MSDPGFPDLRAFLGPAPARRRARASSTPRSTPARGRRDPPPRDRRRRPGAAVPRVRGAELPLVTNLFGTARRAELAFGRRPRTADPPRRRAGGDAAAADAGQALGRARRGGARRCGSGSSARRGGPVTEVVTKDVRLDRLPVLTCWPEDGGPFLTLPLVYTEHPPGRRGPATRPTARNSRACTACRSTTRATTGMHWQIGKGGGFHYAAAEARGEACPSPSSSAGRRR